MRDKSLLDQKITKIFKEKVRRRKALARLPFEKKIEILIALQRMASKIPSNLKGVHRPFWPLTTISGKKTAPHARQKLVRRESWKRILKLEGKVKWKGNLSQMRKGRY